jgi:hypothetical protein
MNSIPNTTDTKGDGRSVQYLILIVMESYIVPTLVSKYAMKTQSKACH